jgi:hypothetical protein
MMLLWLSQYCSEAEARALPPPWLILELRP